MSWWTDEDDDEPELDEDDVRVRPNPRGSRPRTKVRPSHSDAVPARVLSVNRGRYDILIGEDEASSGGRGSGSSSMSGPTNTTERETIATRGRELGKNAIVTGDRVDVVGDTSGAPGTLARIVRVHERITLLRRSADDTDEVERVIVANADQLLIVIAAANPEPRVRLVDRYLVAAYDAGIAPLLCITKTDLADPAPFLANFEGLDIPVFLSAREAMPTAELAAALVGHVSVAVGHSGVGKSTLVNALVPGADRAIGYVNEVTGRGRHTSSSTMSLRLQTDAGSGWIIDTPGVRSFGLGHVQHDNILKAFTDLANIAEDCPRGCTHLPDAPDCAIAEAVAAGELGPNGPARLDSLHRLLLTRST